MDTDKQLTPERLAEIKAIVRKRCGKCLGMPTTLIDYANHSIECELLTAYEQAEQRIVELEAIIAEFPSGAVETLKKWYAEKLRAEKAERQSFPF